MAKIELTVQQARAVELILAGRSLAETAAEVRVDEATLIGWVRIPAFREALHISTEGVMQTATTRLKTAMPAAAHQLAELLNSSNERVKLAASVAILERTMRMIEFTELRDEIKELRAKVDAIAEV